MVVSECLCSPFSTFFLLPVGMKGLTLHIILRNEGVAVSIDRDMVTHPLTVVYP